MKERALCIAILVLGTVLAYSVASIVHYYQQALEQAICEPRVITEYVEVPTEVVVTKEVTREVPVEITKEILVENELVDFVSVEKLEQWLVEDDTDRHIFLNADSDGIIKLTGCCEDHALQLQNRALAAGYKVSVQIIEDKNQLHALNLVRIGNEFYYIEPQTDEFWLAAYLD